MNLVMFDIDGTLTRTDLADEICYVWALHEVFGLTDINTDWSVYPHCTDSGILEEIFQSRHGRSPRVAEVRDFQAHFASLLTGSSKDQPFRPVTGAREFLAKLKERPGSAVSLASGAWEGSARIKLSGAGFDIPNLPAAFSDDAHSREAIMEASLARALLHHGRDSFDSVIYVGDGVWDGRASRNLGFSFIGIANGPDKVDRLRAEGARRVFADYQNPDAIFAALESGSISR